MRGLKYKGAVLVVLWAFLPFAIFTVSQPNTKHFVIFLIIICAVSFPIVGCLSDVCFGRYNTIRYSLRIMWLSLIAFNGFFIVEKYTAIKNEFTPWIVKYLIGNSLMLLLLIFAHTLAGIHGWFPLPGLWLQLHSTAFVTHFILSLDSFFSPSYALG